MVLKSKVGLYQLHKEMCRIKKYFPILFSSTNAFFSLFLFYTKRSCQKYFFTIKILADV